MKVNRLFLIGLLLLVGSIGLSCSENDDRAEKEALYEKINAIDKENVEPPGTRGQS